MDSTIPISFFQNLWVLLFTVIIPIVVLLVALSIYWSYQELKERVVKLEEEKEGYSMLVLKFDHLAGKVSDLYRDSRDIEKRFQYIYSVIDRLAQSESNLTQRVDKVFETQMDTSLIALLNDGLIKELSKGDTPNPPTT